MPYMRLTGSNGVFGWQREDRITLGGLRPRQEYTLLTDAGDMPIRTDSQGAWSGRAAGTVLCAARGDQAALWNEARVTRAAAQSLLAALHAPPPPPKKETAPQPPPPAEKPEPPVAVSYRPASDAPPADALPVLQWPEAAAQLRPYFDTLRPCVLFGETGWHTVKTREAGLDCCFGYHVQGDRVTELLYAVQARGSMIPPKGLQGYQYERALDNSGYWVLRQSV